MDFYTACNIPRPVRLPQTLRQWAWDSLHGKYGDEAMQHPHVALDDIAGFPDLTAMQQYDAAVLCIAEKAPLRLCPCEEISGAATLGDAIRHMVPAVYAGELLCASVSHLTINFQRTLREGVNSYENEIRQKLADPHLDADQREFLHSLQHVIAAMHLWHNRYLELTRTAAPETYARLQQVPFGPARNFHEAVQSLWFVFSFVRLCGNWPGIGRLDVLLGDYLQRDLDAGLLTLDRAREILAHLFIKGCEWIQSDTPTGSGDAQHYQNIVLAGIDETGNEVCNAVTYLVLDIVEELAISDFPITLRVNKNTPSLLLERAAQVIRHGGGIIAVYNEPLVLQAMQRAGYSMAEASRFANDGCWEVQVPGATNFGYIPFDGLQIFDRALGVSGDGEIPSFSSVDALYAAFCGELRKFVQEIYRGVILDAYKQDPHGTWRAVSPGCTSVVSLFEDGCIKNARSYFDFGPVYTVRSPHIGGAPDVGNSLYAIQKLVFEEKRVSLAELVQILRDNWKNHETLRLIAKNKYTYYGNNSQADTWTARVINDFAEIVKDCVQQNAAPVLFVPGVSTFGRQIEWMPARRATAFGAKCGEILSGNTSPTPGTDAAGATAVISSYCKSDLVRQTTGAALDIKLYPTTVQGKNGINALVGLISGFVRLGGFFMQLDVMDADVLRAAQENPEAYKTLSVRVSGWNARFVTLDKEWQEMIIERTAQNV